MGERSTVFNVSNVIQCEKNCVHAIAIANEQTAMAIPFKRINKYVLYTARRIHKHKQHQKNVLSVFVYV